MSELQIKGFKCFSDNTFNLLPITVLAGANGAGKSSLIQAILLCRSVIEKHCNLNEDGVYIINANSHGSIPLNANYKLELGTESDVIKDDKLNKENIILIQFENERFTFRLNSEEGDNLSLQAKVEALGGGNGFLRKKEFYYLNSERLGPRNTLDNSYLAFLHCGYSGEFSAHIIDSLSRISSFESAVLDKEKKFKIEFDYWIDLIFPGICVNADPVSNLKSQISIINSSNKTKQLATNIGFGISYALPIIINGLIAKKDTLFIIENPEAHLHPKAQSTIGLFLGYIASFGVKIIIETHSEHVINGIRKSIFTFEGINEDFFNTYFFIGFVDQILKYEEIISDESGNLSLFPLDFFDQVQQDLFEIRNLSNS